MKSMIRTIVGGMAFISLAALASDYVPSNVAWLTKNNSSGNPTSWPGAGWWQLDGAEAPLDAGISASQDYGVKGNVQLRPKIGTTSFEGKSLSIGLPDQSSSGQLIFRTANGCDTTFANEGLFLNRGAVQSWNGGTQIVRGKVTVRSSDDEPVAVAFTDADGTLEFRCPVESKTRVGLYLHSLIKSSSSMTQTNFVCRFLDDALSAYNGSIVCSPVHYDYRNTVSWYTKDYNSSLKPPYHVTFQTDSGTMPGSLTLYPGAIVAAESAETDFSVGDLASVSLDGYGTNILSVALADDGSACSILRVTKTLSLAAPMAVRLSVDVAGLDVFIATNAAAAMRLPILKAPANVALDPAKFFMERGDALPFLPDYALEVAEDGDDGLSTLWLVRRPVVWAKTADVYKNGASQSSFNENRKENWSNGEMPSDANDCYSAFNLRTPSVNAARTLAGHSLTMGSGTTLTQYGPSVTISNLNTFGKVQIDNLGNGSTANAVAGPQQTWTLAGRIRMWSEDTGRADSENEDTLIFKCYQQKAWSINSELSGKGVLVLRYFQQSGGLSGGNSAWIGLFGMNTNFSGRIYVYHNSPSDAKRTNLLVNDSRNLGGPRPQWTYNALTLRNCCALYPLSSLVLDDETRGILLNGAYAFFTVTNDVVFTCRERITYNGTLVKDGAGELALGGPQPYFTADGTTKPAANKNVLDVREGTLRPVSAAAFQGLAVVITNAAATLAVDVPVSNEDGDIGQYGMLDTTWDAPLTVPETGLTVQLRDPDGILASKKIWRVPVCTVNATAKAALEGMLSVGRSPSRLHAVTTAGWTENEDGSFTFAATIERVGLTVIIR